MIIATQVIYGVVSLGLLPSLTELFGIEAIFNYMTIWTVAALAIFNGVDSRGRVVVLSASAFKVGEFIGPPLVASSVLAFGLDAISILGVVFIIAGLSVLVLADKRYCQRRSK